MSLLYRRRQGPKLGWRQCRRRGVYGFRYTVMTDGAMLDKDRKEVFQVSGLSK